MAHPEKSPDGIAALLARLRNVVVSYQEDDDIIREAADVMEAMQELNAKLVEHNHFLADEDAKHSTLAYQRKHKIDELQATIKRMDKAGTESVAAYNAASKRAERAEAERDAALADAERLRIQNKAAGCLLSFANMAAAKVASYRARVEDGPSYYSAEVDWLIEHNKDIHEWMLRNSASFGISFPETEQAIDAARAQEKP